MNAVTPDCAARHFQLHGRHANSDWQFWVDQLPSGRWVTERAEWVTRRATWQERVADHATRSQALRAGVAKLLRTLRRQRRRGVWRIINAYTPMSDGEYGSVLSWLFGILVREFGRLRRWRWRRAYGRALAVSDRAGWDLDMTYRWREHEARQRVGERPRKGKRAIADYDARLAAQVEYFMQLRADSLRACLIRASTAMLRLQHVRDAKPWR